MKNILSFIKIPPYLVKILSTVSILGGGWLGFHFLSAHLPVVGAYILTYQLERLGCTVHQIGHSTVGWREAKFKNVIFSPEFLEPLDTVCGASVNDSFTQYLMIQEINIYYTPKDLILRQFREVYLNGIRGTLSLGNIDKENCRENSLEELQTPLKELSFTTNYSDFPSKRSNRIDIKNARIRLLTPLGIFQVGIEMSLIGFFSRNTLGNGRIFFHGHQGSIDGMLKVDKIEHRLWRLTLDISNGGLDTPYILGSDINSHLEILIAPRNRHVNGHLHFSHLAFPQYSKNKFTGFETNFKYTLDDHYSLKGDILMKIPEVRWQTVKGCNGHCRLHFSGSLEHPFDRLKGNFNIDEVNIKSYLNAVQLKGNLRLNNQQLTIEGVANRTPLALNFNILHHMTDQKGSIAINALSPLIFKSDGLLLSYFSPILSDYLQKFEGMIFLKGEAQWDKSNLSFLPKFTIENKGVSFNLQDIQVKNLNGIIAFNHLFDKGDISHLTLEKFILPKITLKEVSLQGNFHSPWLYVTALKATLDTRLITLENFRLNLTRKMAGFLPIK